MSRAAQLRSQADKPPFRWPGGRAASGGPNCSASRQLRIAPSESFVSRGSHRAAVGQACEAVCSLEWALGRMRKLPAITKAKRDRSAKRHKRHNMGNRKLHGPPRSAAR